MPSPFELRLRLRVLARQLRRRAFEVLLLAVEPRLAAPRALQLVLDVELEPAETFRLDLDHVAVLEPGETAVVRAGREDVPGFDRMDRAHPLDAARNLMRHVARVV